MPQSDNHSYNLPNQGEQDWHVPLNDNFATFDTDIELRNTASNRGSYTPKGGAKFLATDTGVVSLGDGTNWLPSLALFRFTEPSTSGAAGNLVAGHPSNSAASGVSCATVAGGGFDDGNSTAPNQVTGDFGAVGGGYGNTAGQGAVVAGGTLNDAGGLTTTVGGGSGNTATGSNATVGGGLGNEATSSDTTVAGGSSNTATDIDATVGGGSDNAAGGSRSTVAGGGGNTATGSSATVGGGGSNEASDTVATVAGGGGNTASGRGAAIGGGDDNTATHSHSTVAGGEDNTAGAFDATVGGGQANTASGERATVPGGYNNTADGNYSFACGRAADTNGNDGAVVFGDSSSTAIQAQNFDEFRSQMPMYAPSFNTTSARAAKTDVAPVDPQTALEGVESLDVATWTFTDTDDGRHMGPMAEEFHETFGLGADEGSIPSVDADGVAFAAIQGLAAKLDDREATIERQRDEIDALEETVSALAERVDELADRLDDRPDGAA